MGDAVSGPICLTFNPQLRVEFRGATVTSDAGLLLPRELDRRLGLDALIERYLTDPRTGHNRRFPLAGQHGFLARHVARSAAGADGALVPNQESRSRSGIPLEAAALNCRRTCPATFYAEICCIWLGCVIG